MRGDHAGLLKIEAEMARRVRSTTIMIEGMEGAHSLGYMVRYRGEGCIIERIVPVAFRVYSEG
jgi:hypothetical protein